ncbi:peptidylprolyl isomerase [Gracilibacillus xinjiangensis]|uniref:Peptidyl-prolyl cis-trans isomerase n=1 Tax=Gracilibacillus xinjiangensis TaxID=1193282 RepID=A0ABV8WST2_9BACI
MRKWLYLLLVLLTIISAGCSQVKQNKSDFSEGNDGGQVAISEGERPIVTIEMDSGKEMVVELYPEFAPKTVENFIKLVEQEFYDGLTFHRVIPGFMIQGGDPNGDGTGGADHQIVGEFESNGYDNPLLHEEGVISMARSQDFDSASSQFFIMVEDSPHLDGDYAAFGKVISGIETAQEIASVEREHNDKPKEDQVIKKMTVELSEE